jgi:hypothetical protein
MSNRQDNVYITASITDGEGNLSLGRWEDRSGGQSDSASTTYARAGIGGRTALGGRQEVANVVIKRLYDTEMQGVIARLRKGAGKAFMQITEQTTDDEGTVITGSPTETWRGILKSVHVLDRSTETAAAETLELEMVVDGEVAVT